MQSDKWTVEGAVKAGFPVSILQRSASVTGEGCVGTLLKFKVVPQVYSIIACPCIFTGTGFFI